MEKSLYKNLYSKRNKKPTYPKVNRYIESTSIESDLIKIDNVSLARSTKDHIYKRYIFSSVVVLGLIFSIFITANNIQFTDQQLDSDIVTESNIPRSSTTSTTKSAAVASTVPDSKVAPM